MLDFFGSNRFWINCLNEHLSVLDHPCHVKYGFLHWKSAGLVKGFPVNKLKNDFLFVLAYFFIVVTSLISNQQIDSFVIEIAQIEQCWLILFLAFCCTGKLQKN